ADAIALPAVAARHFEVPRPLVLGKLDRRQPLFQQVERFLLGLMHAAFSRGKNKVSSAAESKLRMSSERPSPLRTAAVHPAPLHSSNRLSASATAARSAGANFWRGAPAACRPHPPPAL